jgi:multidrug efflux pump subunit AcrA (membrane-fusion protein)
MVNGERGDRVKKGQIIAKLTSGIQKVNVKLMKVSSYMNADINACKAEYDLKKTVYEPLVLMYEKSYSVPDVSERLGISDKSLYYWVSEAKIPASQSAE